MQLSGVKCVEPNVLEIRVKSKADFLQYKCEVENLLYRIPDMTTVSKLVRYYFIKSRDFYTSKFSSAKRKFALICFIS
jgi:hypothetical protein